MTKRDTTGSSATSALVLSRTAITRKMRRVGLSRSDLAEKLGVARPTIDVWLDGQEFPRSDKLLKLAMVLRLPYEQLVLRPDEGKPVIVCIG